MQLAHLARVDGWQIPCQIGRIQSLPHVNLWCTCMNAYWRAVQVDKRSNTIEDAPSHMSGQLRDWLTLDFSISSRLLCYSRLVPIPIRKKIETSVLIYHLCWTSSYVELSYYILYHRNVKQISLAKNQPVKTHNRLKLLSNMPLTALIRLNDGHK